MRWQVNDIEFSAKRFAIAKRGAGIWVLTRSVSHGQGSFGRRFLKLRSTFKASTLWQVNDIDLRLNVLPSPRQEPAFGVLTRSGSHGQGSFGRRFLKLRSTFKASTSSQVNDIEFRMNVLPSPRQELVLGLWRKVAGADLPRGPWARGRAAAAKPRCAQSGYPLDSGDHNGLWLGNGWVWFVG